MLSRIQFILCVLPLTGLAQWAESGKTDLALDGLFRAVAAYEQAAEQGLEPGSEDDLIAAIEQLETAVRRASEFKVDRWTKSVLDVNVHSRMVFGSVPKIPAENKTDNRWSFVPTTFQVKPGSLYVFGVKFQASRTMRLKAVTLHFRDGSRVVHDDWMDLNDGNGQDFRKEKYIRMLPAYGPEEKRRARPLAAIEILGSAQDRDFDARLDFIFRIPDPSARPFLAALDLIDNIKRRWAQSAQESQLSSQRLRPDLEAIAVALNREDRLISVKSDQPSHDEAAEASTNPPSRRE